MNRTESATAIACVAVIGSISLVSAGMIRGGENGSIASQDADKLQNLHQAMLHFACDDPTGALPTPGRINLWTDSELGGNPSFGLENQGKNTSGNLYSSLIAQQYITTADVISPAEVADNVQEYNGSAGNGAPTGTGYEYDTYDPANDIFWVGDVADPDQVGNSMDFQFNYRFRVRINRPYDPENGSLCSASYAHLQLCGKRKNLSWRVDASAHTPLLSNRGTRNGASEGRDFTESPTLLFYQPHDAWQGNVLFGDGHVDFSRSFMPDGVTYVCTAGQAVPDNIFHAEFESCTGSYPNSSWREGDAWLALSEVIVRHGSSGAWRAIPLFDKKLDKRPRLNTQ